MSESSENRHVELKPFKTRWLVVLLGLLIGVGVLLVPPLYAVLFDYIFPADKQIVIDRSFEPADLGSVGNGGTITVTVDISNDENVDLRGFYYSDQVPDNWGVSTVGVWVNGAPVMDTHYESGSAGEIYAGYRPHRWAVEEPQGGGGFTPTHPISAAGGTARIVFQMVVSGGTGDDYTFGYEAWAGWLETSPDGTALFGYQGITETLAADFTASPRFGLAPLQVQFTDLSSGGVLTYSWSFGDGGSSSQANPLYSYTESGFYTVSLTVENAYDSDVLVKTGYIRVLDELHDIYLPLIIRLS